MLPAESNIACVFSAMSLRLIVLLGRDCLIKTFYDLLDEERLRASQKIRPR